jgi:thymidylate synthase
MRIYTDAKEAYEEIKRDLMEMGIEVKPKTMQDKNVEGDPSYFTKELQNYSYSILNVKSVDIPNVVQPWSDAEFAERVQVPKTCEETSNCNNCWYSQNNIDCPEDSEGRSDGAYVKFVNPGEAYKLRPKVWNEYLHEGKFGYTYNERIWQNDQITKIITRLKEDPGSRQLWLSLWNPMIDPSNLGGVSRVPCSLGYNFQVREGKLNIHYIMRSCDFSTHFCNDVYLAIKLLEYVAELTGYEVGSFTHTIFSFHVYHKDIKGVF